jgi:glycosyltransferase involved in cell wall biosynthesis
MLPAENRLDLFFPEAMINKTPIVTTPTGAAKDALAHLESAYLVDYNNPEQLAEGIKFVLNNDTSGMTLRAEQKAKELFNIDRMFEQHLNLYRSSHAGK